MIKFLYKNIAKPVLFKFDPESVHDWMINTGNLLGQLPSTRWLTKKCFHYQHPSLEQKILGIDFKNPIGLAAGFDKDARITDILPSVGFGFAELGSVTAFPCPGNPQPRLWRLPKSKSIMVNYGLNNRGSEVISKELNQKTFQIPIGISLARTNIPQVSSVESGVLDYKISLERFATIGSYVTLNISCPNAYGGSPFTIPENLEQLLTTLDTVETKLPIFLKLSPDLSRENIDKILAVCSHHRVNGLIISNLTKQVNNSEMKPGEKPLLGGLSGKSVESLANECISYIYQKTNKRYVIIGCGGIFSAKDAYLKIKLGASLVQLITGMIYEGPQLIGDINRKLAKLLKKDGYKNISEAIGVSALNNKN
jgi:dihydroorotate dehydrogenase